MSANEADKKRSPIDPQSEGEVVDGLAIFEEPEIQADPIQTILYEENVVEEAGARGQAKRGRPTRAEQELNNKERAENLARKLASNPPGRKSKRLEQKAKKL